MADEDKYKPEGQEEEEEEIDETVRTRKLVGKNPNNISGLHCTKRCCTLCH